MTCVQFLLRPLLQATNWLALQDRIHWQLGLATHCNSKQDDTTATFAHSQILPKDQTRMVRNVSTVMIACSAQRVWSMLTEPALIKKWQFGSVLSTDWNIDSGIRFETEWQGQVFQQWGTVLEFLPCERIRYSLFAPRPGVEDKPENYFEMQYSLSQYDGGTRLEITQVDNRPGAEQEAPQDETSNPILATLKSMAEE